MDNSESYVLSNENDNNNEDNITFISNDLDIDKNNDEKDNLSSNEKNETNKEDITPDSNDLNYNDDNNVEVENDATNDEDEDIESNKEDITSIFNDLDSDEDNIVEENNDLSNENIKYDEDDITYDPDYLDNDENTSNEEKANIQEDTNNEENKDEKMESNNEKNDEDFNKIYDKIMSKFKDTDTLESQNDLENSNDNNSNNDENNEESDENFNEIYDKIMRKFKNDNNSKENTIDTSLEKDKYEENNEVSENKKDDKDKILEKENDEKTTIEDKENENDEKINNKKNNIFSKTISILLFIGGLLYLLYTIFYCNEKANYTYLTVNSSIILATTFMLLICCLITKKVIKNLFKVLTILSIIGLVIFNILLKFKIITLPTQEFLKDFKNTTITEALKWAKENNIEATQRYEFSDDIIEYNIISQDVAPNTLLKKVKKISFIVSNGPDYNKVVSVPNMVGWNIEKVIELINNNHLNNVIIDYELNSEVKKDDVINQNFFGEMKRSDELKLTVSIGTEKDLVPVKMIDLKNKSLFEATLWLKRNGFKYEIVYVFSDSIKKDIVMSQEAKIDEMYDPKTDIIKLIVSKGQKVVVPDLTKLSIDEINEWILKNNLKANFEEEYSSTIERGKVIKANYKENDEVESGTLITITTSRGPLTMPKLKTLDEFRKWAEENKIQYQENYEFNKDVKNGEIIRIVPSAGTVINYSDTVNIYISYGDSVTIPSFVGKSKDEIESQCNNVGLNCTFYYSGYSSTPYNVCVEQNKVAGAEVVSGTYVSIGLSNGPKPEENNPTPTPQPTPQPTQQPEPQPTPTPQPEPTQACNPNDTEFIWLEYANNGADTATLIKKKYPNIKWNISLVDSCPNTGEIATAIICNAPDINEKNLNHCDTYDLIIVK